MKSGKHAVLLTAILFIPLIIGVVITVGDMGRFGRDDRRGPPEPLTGSTMGTTWRLVLIAAPPDGVRAAIEEELERVNREMSTYRDDSEITAFNRASTTDWTGVSPGFATVASRALVVGQRSGGALDVTLGPAIDLWGFGRQGPRASPPSEEEIAGVAKRVGLDKLAVETAPPRIRKTVGSLALDLSAIAKGHGVDRVARRLDALGVKSYFLEIGGEIFVRGRKSNRPWRVALERPDETGREVELVIPVEDLAVATSGNYRQFFRDQGRKYSHTLDPTTIRPVTHDLASVSVVAPSCVDADAWATALMVLGPERGLAVAEREALCALLIERTEEGFRQLPTSAWKTRFGAR